MNFLGFGRFETIVEVLIVTVVSAVFTYIGLHNPFLLRAAKIFCFALYVTAPLCWFMPLRFRIAHLVVWLASVLCWWIWILFTSWHEGEEIGALYVAGEIIIGPLVDLVFLTNGIMAIRSKLAMWDLRISLRFLILIGASMTAMTASLLFWSHAVANDITSNAADLSNKAPFCMAANGKMVTNSSELSGLRLLRQRYFVGEGAGFSIPIFSRFYLILAVKRDGHVRYWNWSFGTNKFRELTFPVSHFVSGYACDPVSKKVIGIEDQHIGI
ncbi:MAG: hypothetical protein AB1508_15305 [Pseudomonadota bacterium]